jgi:Transcription factor Tfb4
MANDDKLSNKIKINVRPAGGLHARLAQNEILKEVIKIDAQTLPNRIGLMLDKSGSMAGQPIKDLCEAAQNFIMQMNPESTALAIETFPKELHVDLSNDKPMLMLLAMGLSGDGSTPLGECLRDMASTDLTRGVLISDGEPTDMAYRDRYNSDFDEVNKGVYDFSCLDHYIKSKIPIDTIHIGKSVDGEGCLQEIAKRTGGVFIKFKDIKTLVEKLHFLLPEQRHILGLPEAREILGADDLR